MSIRTRTIIGILIIELLLVGILIFSNILHLTEQAEGEIKRRADFIGTFFASSAKNAVISFDIASLNDYVKDIVKNEGVVYSRIITNGIIVTEAGESPRPIRSFKEDSNLSAVDDGVYDLEYPIEEAGRTFAKVQLGISTVDLQQNIIEEKYNAMFIGAMGIALSALFSFLLGSYLTSRVKRLGDASKLIANNQFDFHLQDSGTDEIALTSKAFNKMSSKIQEKINQLDLEKQKANAANEAKTMFLANMSHEIRTPLNAIINLSNLIELAQDDYQKEDILHKINLSSQALKSMVSDILDISKIEAGEFSLENIDFDLYKTLQNTTAIFEEQCKDKGIRFEADFESIKGLVYHSDQARLTQILLNLLSNAVKFTHRGFIKLSVHNSGKNDQKKLHIIVQDSGIGIPQDKLASLFDAFVQAESSTNRKYGGSGLGLAICKLITDEFKGNISVESTKNLGSVFSLEIPIEYYQKVSLAKQKITAKDDLPTNEVLVFEDNSINQFVVQMLLKKLGQKVRIAENGVEGIELLGKHPYDFILMDFQMPIMDGFEATKKIRELELEQNRVPTPIIAMTANAIARHKDEALSMGMNDYLSKPVDIQSLRRVIRKWGKFGSEKKLLGSNSLESIGLESNSLERGNHTDYSTQIAVQSPSNNPCTIEAGNV